MCSRMPTATTSRPSLERRRDTTWPMRWWPQPAVQRYTRCPRPPWAHTRTRPSVRCQAPVVQELLPRVHRLLFSQSLAPYCSPPAPRYTLHY